MDKQINNPTISVIMSAYNSEKYIAEAIKSILNQTFKDFELIIFEDGSTDNTKKIVQKYSKKDKRIIPVYNKKNIGYVGFIKNLNKGLKIAKGKYIARMDADDISLPERFQIQYDFLEKHKEIFLVGSFMIAISEKNDELGIRALPQKMNEIKKQIVHDNCIIHPSIFFRNERDLMYREKILYCEDYDFYLRLILQGKILENLPILLVKHRFHEGAVSVTKQYKQKLFAKKSQEFYHSGLKKGEQKYQKFNPEEITSLEIDLNQEKSFEILTLGYLFKKNEMKEFRKYSAIYFKNYGLLNKMMFYHLISFLPVKFLEFIRKILWGRELRWKN